MTKQITLEEALKLVSFKHVPGWGWRIRAVNGSVYGFVNGDINGFVDGHINGFVNGDVYGDVEGDVYGNVRGDVNGYVGGDVEGDIYGHVVGKINGRKWTFIETPKDKLQRLITESGNQELIDAFNQLEDNLLSDEEKEILIALH